MSGLTRSGNAKSHSASPLLQALLEGPLTRGQVLDRRRVAFGEYVVVLTAPGAPRMPNGIESEVGLKAGDRVAAGGGRFVRGREAFDLGLPWNPRPTVSVAHVWPPGPAPVTVEAGLGPVWQEHVLAGYIAGLVLLHHQEVRAGRLAEAAAARSEPDVATMLRHAALGEVPEPVHSLFESGKPGSLMAYDAGRGAAWLRGLVSAGYALDAGALRTAAAGAAR